MERTFFSFFSFPDNFIHRILQFGILSTYNLTKKNNYFCSHAFFWLEIPIQNSHMYLCMYMYIYACINIYMSKLSAKIYNKVSTQNNLKITTEYK